MPEGTEAGLIKVDLPSVGGGINQSSAPSQIQDHESADLLNFYPRENRLIRRDGVFRLSSEAYAETLHGLGAYSKSGTWQVIAGALTGMARLDGNVFVEIPHTAGLSLASGPYPWSLHQYQQIMYGLRNDGTQFFRCDGDIYGPSGIVAPTTAPTIADGGAGSLASGDYVAAVAFRNSRTGAISNLSPLSSTLALGASKQIQWTNIPVPSSGQADSRVLFRSLANMIGVTYQVTILEDTTTTSWVDDITPDEQGDQSNLDNGVPPAGGIMMCIWRERAFVADTRDLFFSRAYFPESFGEFNYMSVSPDDGHLMGGVHPFGDRLLLGKTNAMYYLLGTGPENFTVRTLDDKAGCHSHDSMQSFEGIGIWYGGTNFYKTDGSRAIGIGDIKIRRALDNIPPEYYYRVGSAYIPKFKWYMASLPGADGNPETLAVHDISANTWTLFNYGDFGAPSVMREFADENQSRVLYGSFNDGQLYQVNRGNKDHEDLITARWKSKAFDFNAKGMLKKSKRLGWLFYPHDDDTESLSGEMYAKVYGWDRNKVTASRSRRFAVESLPRYARVALSTKEATKLIQYELEYTGEESIELAEVSIEAVSYQKGGKVV